MKSNSCRNNQNTSRNISYIESENSLNARNSGIHKHPYNTRLSARCSELASNSSLNSLNNQRTKNNHLLISLNNQEIQSNNSWRRNSTNSLASGDSTLLDDYTRIPLSLEYRPINMSLRSHHSTHLDPCSYAEPPCPSNRWFKLLAVASTIAMCAILYKTGVDLTFNGDLDATIKKELHGIQNQINSIQDNVDTVLKRKEESAAKMAHVETLLEEIRKTTGETPKKDPNTPMDPVTNAIEKAFEMHNNDKTGLPDYALETAGGSIANIRNTETVKKGAAVQLFGWTVCQGSSGPRSMLHPGMLPGECWAFKGATGQVVIRLMDKIYVDGVSIEHISKAISPTKEISTAPKEFSIHALTAPDSTDGEILGSFIYNADGPPLQYFQVETQSPLTQFVEIKFLSNHGNVDYTCVYRVRIHGKTTLLK